MGSGDKPRLRLERETLRDLAPSLEEIRSVRGGEDDDSTSGKSDRFCMPDYMDAMVISLGRTFMSYGCFGKVRFEQTETGYEMHFELQPNKETAELHEMTKQKVIARNPEIGERLDEIGRRFE